MNRVRFSLLVVSLCLLATGCLGSLTSPVPQGTASLSVYAVLPDQVIEPGTTIELILRQDARELRFDLPYDGESVTYGVNSLYEGEWEVVLQVVDGEDDVIFLATSDVLLFSDQTTYAELDLVPAPGLLEVYIDLTTFQDNHKVGRARVSVNPGGYSSSVREEGSNIIRIEREVDPRTYDFRVSLYGEEYTNAIYNSPWQPVTVRPGKVTSVVWSVGKGELQVVGRVFPSPGQPQNFHVEPINDGKQLRFTWKLGPASEYATGYRIYERNTPFGYYRLIHEVDGNTLEWTMDAPSVKGEQTWMYAVAAISEVGLEGPRSEPFAISFPIASK